MSAVEQPILERLRAENRQYRDNFDQLKQAHEELQDKYENLGKEFQIALNEKSHFEQSHDGMVEEWRKQLDAKAREFDHLRQQLDDPRNLDVLRQQFLAEYEKSYRERLDTVIKETEKWRSSVFTLQRTFDDYQRQSEMKERDYRSTLEDMALNHEETLYKMKLQLSEKAKATDEMVFLYKRVKELSQQNTELQARVKGLTAEVEDVRNLSVDEKTKGEYQIRNLQRQLSDAEAFSKTLESEKEAQRSKVSRLEDELHNAIKSLEQSRQENSNINVALNKSSVRQDEIVHQFKLEAENAHFAFVKERAEWEQQRTELKKQLDSKQHEINQFKSMLQEKDESVAAIERATIEKVRIAREEEWAKLRDVDTEKRDIEKKLAEVTQQLQTDRATMESNRKELSGSVERLRNECQNYQSRNQSLLSQLDKSSTELEYCRTEINSLHQRLQKSEEESSVLKIDISKLQKTENDARRRLDVMENEYSRLQRDLSVREEELNRERERFIEASELSKAAWSKEKESLNTQLAASKTEQDRLAAQYQELVVTVKKLRGGYKKRLEEANSARQDSEERLSKILMENQSLHKRLENESQGANLQVREMQRKHQEFLQFMQKEGVLPIS